MESVEFLFGRKKRNDFTFFDVLINIEELINPTLNDIRFVVVTIDILFVV